MKRMTVLAGMVMVVMLAIVPAVSADAMTWSGIVAYPNGTWVPHNTVLSMENLNQSYPTEPWWDITGDWGGYNGWVDGEKGSESDYMKINASTVDGMWYGEITPRLSDTWNAGPIGNVYWMNITVYPTSTPDMNWTQFQYDIANTGNTPAVAPDSNQTKWITADIGAVEGSQAMIKDDKVFVYANDYVRALNKTYGTSVWDTFIYGDTSGFGSWASPAYSDGKLYVSSGYNISRIDAAGGALEQLVPFPDGGHSCNGGPTVKDGVVYAGSGYGNPTAHYYALNASDLTDVIWSVSVGFDVAGSTPAVAGDRVIFGNGTNLTCVNTSGYLLWTTNLSSGTILGSAAIDSANDRVYVATGSGSLALLHALDLNGNLIWTSSTAIDFTDGTPAFMDADHVYISGNAYATPGHTYCFNSTGDLQWSVPRGSWVMSPAVTADGKLITGDCDDMGGWGVFEGIGAYNATTGALIWEYAYGGSSPSVANSDPMVVSIGKNGKVYAFGTPAPTWINVSVECGHTIGVDPSCHESVPIHLEDVTMYGTGTIHMYYNKSVVEVDSVTGSDDSILDAWNKPEPGHIIISAHNADGVNNTVVFAYVTFRPTGNSNECAYLNLTVETLYDTDYVPIDTNTVNCSICIQEEDAPEVSNPTASPDTILNDNGRLRVPGTNESRLNVTVTDYTGIANVTIDLSPILGPGNGTATDMELIEGDARNGVWSVVTNAPYDPCVDSTSCLVVNATDIFDNSQSDVCIPLTVLRRGDVVHTNTVNMGDALYIARWTVGLEAEPDEFIAGIVPAASWNGVDMGDALYIARRSVGKETTDP